MVSLLLEAVGAIWSNRLVYWHIVHLGCDQMLLMQISELLVAYCIRFGLLIVGLLLLKVSLLEVWHLVVNHLLRHLLLIVSLILLLRDIVCKLLICFSRLLLRYLLLLLLGRLLLLWNFCTLLSLHLPFHKLSK